MRRTVFRGFSRYKGLPPVTLDIKYELRDLANRLPRISKREEAYCEYLP